MKRIILAGALWVALAATAVPMAIAQPGGDPGKSGPRWTENQEERSARRVARLTDELDLSESQQKELQDIVDQRHAEAKAWFDGNPEASRDDRQTFMKAHRDAVSSSIGEILNDKQKERFDELQTRISSRASARRWMRSPRGHTWGRGFMAGRMAEHLDLTNDQVKQIAELKAEQKRAMREGLESILSEEQLESLGEFREDRGRHHKRGRGRL